MTTHGVAAFPLYWPLEHARAKTRRSALFQVDFATARAQLLRELSLLGASDVLLSTNIPLRRDGLPTVPDREPDDPGVALYFQRSGRGYVIACDAFTKIRWNLRAIGATVEALRAIERHATSTMLERAFSGFAALPPGPASPALDWRSVLGIPSGRTNIGVVRSRYHALAHQHHPDAGGQPARMAEINEAYDAALREFGERT